jgi:phage baseplate assembly protein W
MNDYYNLPLKMGDLIEKKEHQRCTLSESVASMIHLIAISHFGECKHDESFGCEIWEHDFESIINPQLYKEQLKESIQKTIEMYEPRLSIARVEIQIEQIEQRAGNRRTKSRISINVKGSLKKTNEQFACTEKFFIGPLSYTL